MNLSALDRDSSLTTLQAKRISDSIEMVTCCTSEIRTMSYLLHPPLLDEMGLPAALAGYSDGFAERSGIRVELDITKDLERLPTDSETGLFRIVQQKSSIFTAILVAVLQRSQLCKIRKELL